MVLPRLEDGALVPLTCPIECFKVFGEGVYSYVVWQRLMMQTFFIIFLIALPNTIHNIEGGGLKDASWMTVHTLGNVDDLNSSYGVVEVMVELTLIFALFYGSRLLAKAHVDFAGDSTQDVVASRSVRLCGLAADTKPNELRAFMSRYGDVRTLTVVRANRPLILRLKARVALLDDVLQQRALVYKLARERRSAQRKRVSVTAAKVKAQRTELSVAGGHVEKCHDIASDRHGSARHLLLPGGSCGGQSDDAGGQRGGKPHVTLGAATENVLELAAMAKAMVKGGSVESAERLQKAKLEASIRKLQQFDNMSSELITRYYPCSGDAFVSYSSNAEAHAATAAFNSGHGLRGVIARQPPEPSDIQWENVPCSRTERVLRQLVSTTITVLIACFGTVVIAATTLIQGTKLLDQFITHPPGFSGVLTTLLLSLAMVLPVILGNILLFATSPPLADLLERHITHTGKERALFLKMTFFQATHSLEPPSMHSPLRLPTHTTSRRIAQLAWCRH